MPSELAGHLQVSSHLATVIEIDLELHEGGPEVALLARCWWHLETCAFSSPSLGSELALFVGVTPGV